MQPISYYFFHEEENFHFIHSCGPKLKDEKEKFHFKLFSLFMRNSCVTTMQRRKIKHELYFNLNSLLITKYLIFSINSIISKF